MRDGDSGDRNHVGADEVVSDAVRAVVGNWYHSREESDAGHKVYRDSSYDFPPARQPREVLRLNDDGTASIGRPNAADRTDRRPAQWHFADGVITVDDGSSVIEFQVVATSSGEVVLHTTQRGENSDAQQED